MMCVPMPGYVAWQAAAPFPPTGTAPQPVTPSPPSVKATVPPLGMGDTVAVYVT